MLPNVLGRTRELWSIRRLLLIFGGLLGFAGIAVLCVLAWFMADPARGLKTAQEWMIDQQFGAPVQVKHTTGSVTLWMSEKPGSRTFVFVHGFGDAGAGWTNTAAIVAQSHSVVIVDLPGHGRSDLGDAPLTIDLLREGLNAVLAEVDGPVTLVGNSMGGWVSAEWTLRHVDRVDQLILVNTAGFSVTLERSSLLPVTRDGVAVKNRIVMGDHAPPLPGFILDGFVEMNRTPHLHALFDHLMNDALHLEGRFQGLHVPTILVWGTPDAYFPKDGYLTAVQREFPDAPTRILSGCGHAPQYGCPRELAEVLLGR